MTVRKRRRVGLAGAALLVLMVACSFGAEAPSPTATVTTIPAGPTRTPFSFMPELTEAPTEDPGECEPPTPQIQIAEPVEGQLPTGGETSPERTYFCVMLPEETIRAIFELSGTEAALNLFVGYPDLETVQDGGILFWSNMTGEPGDKQVIAEMGVRDYLFAGPYYIEIALDDFQESSPFRLVVTIEQP